MRECLRVIPVAISQRLLVVRGVEGLDSLPRASGVVQLEPGATGPGVHGFPSASSRLIYSAEYNDQQGQETIFIYVRNPTDNAINDQTTDFNLLVIDAQ